MPKIEWAKDALDDLQKIDKPIVKRILKKISWLSQHFDDIPPEPLSGELAGTFKLRIGDWRVIYTIENEMITIIFKLLDIEGKFILNSFPHAL